MLRFAYWAGLCGVAAALGLALLAWLRVPAAGLGAPYIVLFVSVFFSFAPAIMAHPAHTRSGGNFSLDPHALRTAEPWTIALSLALFVALIVSVFLYFPHGDEHDLTSAALIGRLDRQLTLCCFYAAFHAMAVTAASSGLRWDLALSGSAPGPSLSAIDSAEPGAPLVHRHAKVGWFVIAGETLSVLLAAAFSGDTLSHFVPSPYGKWLLLSLLALVPIWHAVLKLYGRTTFLVKEGNLVVRHFPFKSQNRRIPVRDIRGIQVNAEVNEEGKVTHYSLLLVDQRFGTDRLVDHLPDAADARHLAQQIDVVVRGGESIRSVIY